MTIPTANMPVIAPDLQAGLARTNALAGPMGVDAMIYDQQGRLFVQKRSDNRPFLPGCWDGTGGHVEDGETLLQAMCREVTEETGWHLREIKALLHAHSWIGRNDVQLSGFVYLATATGDLANPSLEPDKVSDARWIGRDDLPLLLENRPAHDTGPYYAAAQAAFDWLDAQDVRGSVNG